MVIHYLINKILLFVFNVQLIADIAQKINLQSAYNVVKEHIC